MNTYALIGDSHSVVYFPLLQGKIEEQGDKVVSIFSNNGWTVKKYLDNNLEGELRRTKPNSLVISLGGNNGLLTPAYGSIVGSLLTIADNLGIKNIYWVSPAYSLNQEVNARHHWTTEYLKANLPKKVRFIDIRPITKTGHKPDGVHFTPTKYGEWASFVFKSLKQELAINQIPSWVWWFGGSTITLGIMTFLLRKRR